MAQYDIDNLVRELQNLIPVLEKLAKTPATSTSQDRGVDRIVNALAKLTVTVKGQTATREKEQKAMKRFVDSVDRATKAQADQADQLAKELKDRKDQADKLKKAEEERAEAARRAALSDNERRREDQERARQEKLNSAADALYARRKQEREKTATSSAQDLIAEYGRGVTGTAALRDKFESLGGNSIGASVGLKLTTAALEGLVGGLAEYGKAVYRGEIGAKSAAKGVTTFVKTVASAAQALGGILMLIPGFQLLGAGLLAAGTAAKGFAEYTEAAAEMSDRLYKTYQDLSKSGVTAGDGMTGLASSARKLGYGLDDGEVGLQKFVALVAKSSEDLALFGTTAMEGRKKFAEVGEGFARGPFGRSLQNMGMSVDGINEGLMSYLALQSRVGMTQNKTTEELRKGAAAYLVEMDGLTKLTGIQRQELEQNINKARAVEQFRAKVEAMRASGDEKQIAAADEMERYYAILAKKAPELAQGFAESASGLIVSPAGIKYQQTIGFATGATEKLADGSMKATDAYIASAKAGKQFAKDHNALGQAGAVAASGLGNFVEAANLGADANKDNAKVLGDIDKAQKAQMEGIGDGTDAATRLRNEQLNSRDALQSMVLKGVNPATQALGGFAGFLNKITGVTKTEAPAAAAAAGGGKFARRGSKYRGGETPETPPVAPATAAPGTAPAGPAGPELGSREAAIAQMRQQYGGGGGAAVPAAPGAGGAEPALGSTRAGLEKTLAADPKKILDFIAKYESNGKYDVMVGGKTIPSLTSMSVAEVLDFQRRYGGSGAAGRYQIIPRTLEGIMGPAGVGIDDKFDASTQDKLGMALLERRGYSAFKAGKITPEQFANNLAKEWAALPVASGKSYYEGVGGNKSAKGMSQAEVISAITAQAAFGGVFAGPKSGYAAMLHGTEAVIPMSADRKMPVDVAGMTDSITQAFAPQMQAMQAQISRLDELVSLMRRQATTGERMLQIKQA